jgi:uncharacterized protein
MIGTGQTASAAAGELEQLKRRIVNADRAGSERGRRMSYLYRAADRFSRRLFPATFCAGIQDQSGCATGQCCRCRPDVFSYEKEVLDLLPKRLDDSGYCPFFNRAKHICGIYQVRPLACRIYYNLGSSAYYCQNPNDATLHLLDALKRHVEQILGPYLGGYQP